MRLRQREHYDRRQHGPPDDTSRRCIDAQPAHGCPSDSGGCRTLPQSIEKCLEGRHFAVSSSSSRIRSRSLTLSSSSSNRLSRRSSGELRKNRLTRYRRALRLASARPTVGLYRKARPAFALVWQTKPFSSRIRIVVRTVL